MAVVAKETKHFVLVHGSGHGAWCWYKLKPLLESAGHRVTALDLAASGIDSRQIHELFTLADYSAPLMEFMASIPPEEKVILVGHSYGGMNLALAMEKYPERILVAVFLTAVMPDTAHSPSYVFDKSMEKTPEQNPAEEWMDTQFVPYGSPADPRTAAIMGPKYLASKLYQLCSIEDLELAKMLVRPSSIFTEDLSKAPNFTNEGYGSVRGAYILCHEDKYLPKDFQQWMIDNFSVAEVKEIRDADHTAMLSKPQQVCDCVLEIADHYE